MPITDVAAFLGQYPFRAAVDGSPEWLLLQMDRLGIERAWVGSLPSMLHQDPAPANRALVDRTRPHADRLLPVPTINPDQAVWQDDLNMALEIGAPAVRLFPGHQGLDPMGGEVRVAVVAAAAAGLPVVLTVRFEDARQRHPLDVVPELSGAALRAMARLDPQVRLVVSHADRSLIEEVHFGLTPTEARRVLWDLAWVWGPPLDDVGHVLRTIGVERFVLGTGMPLRIGDTVFARLELAQVSPLERQQILAGNLESW